MERITKGDLGLPAKQSVDLVSIGFDCLSLRHMEGELKKSSAPLGKRLVPERAW